MTVALRCALALLAGGVIGFVFGYRWCHRDERAVRAELVARVIACEDEAARLRQENADLRAHMAEAARRLTEAVADIAEDGADWGAWEAEIRDTTP